MSEQEKAISKQGLVEKGMQPAKIQAAPVKITPSNPVAPPKQSK